MDMLKHFAQEAKKLKGTVVFAEGDEERTLEAATKLAADGVCKAILVAKKKDDVEKVAKRKKLDLSGVSILLPSRDRVSAEALQRFVEHKRHKGVGEKEAYALSLDPLYFSALYTKSGGANSLVAGARSDTADVLRAAIYGIGGGQGTRLISSFFLMVPPVGHPVAKSPFFYADCAVNPDPSALGLTEIAQSTVRSFKMLFPEETARVAFLSFSTRGSAEHQDLKKIRQAVNAVQKKFASDTKVVVDGELQFDAAVIPAIAERKAPDSPLKGNANIFIFPDLNSGNICYKMTERFALCKAIGPVLQGIQKPVSDLSRGCSVDDIYHVAALTLLQSVKG